MEIDSFIVRLQALERIQESEIVSLFEIAQTIFIQEGTVLALDAPISICGDIHGQFHDLLQMFKLSGELPETSYLFLGDYVDRGRYSLETFCLLVAYKVKYPGNIFLLRGNHECRQVNAHYGFYQEIVLTYGHPGLWHLCNDLFDYLPMACVIENKVYCIHGGLSPRLPLIETLCLMNRKNEIPSEGTLSDICWSDPDDIAEWGLNPRGAGFLYGERPTAEFCHNNGLKFIARAHQLAMKGYQWHFDKNQLITIWTAPNYMYRSGNSASVMKLDTNCEYTFVDFQAAEGQDGVVIEDLPLSY